jgi:DNA repair protein RecN (Recombination protein N)
MLVEIKVKNFAIIECLSFELGVGLNIISGETGSGKSVILKSLSLLMGEKASSETVKVGADQASIEGYFDLHNRPDVSKKLKEMGLAGEENELIARRVITNQGKGRVYLNGHLCNLNDLREVISPLLEINGYNPPLIEMTGQHESKALLDKTFHIDILDRFSNCLNLRNSFEIILDEYRNLMQEL